MHYAEHKVSAEVYKKSHKPHHVFRVPRLFDAFNGSMPDTIFMILVPLYITCNVVHCNVWSYMAFGTLYANYLTLIHRWELEARAAGACPRDARRTPVPVSPNPLPHPDHPQRVRSSVGQGVSCGWNCDAQ